MLAILLSIVIFHTWLAGYSREQESGRTTYYYSYLARAFMEGNLHLPLRPDPELLALEDPYDLSARAELEKRGIITPVDFSLYKGRFYLYWGPVPALLLIVLQSISRQPLADFFLAFLFGIGILLAQTLLLTAVWRQCFSTLPAWAYYISILLAGLIWPVALLRHEYNHARIYEAAIAAGQFFLMLGFWTAFTAISKPTMPNLRLTFAGLLWALAIASRQMLLFPIAFLVILTAFWINRIQAENTAKIIKLICLTLPLAIGGVLLAWYNWARFDSITETGFFWALAGVDLSNHSGELFSSTYVSQNLFNYLLNPPHVMQDFPFVSMLKGNKSLGLPFYYAEPMTGLLYFFPFAAFVIVPCIVFLLNRFNTYRSMAPASDNDLCSLRWITYSLSGSFLISFLLLLLFFWSAMRYMADFLPSLTALSAIGLWQGDDLFKQKNPYRTAGFLLASGSIAISTLLAISTL